MNKSISYPESELIQTLSALLTYIEDASAEVKMIEQQGLGLRNNLDWASSGKVLRIKIEKMKSCLNTFHMLKYVENRDINMYTYKDYLPIVKKEFDEENNKRENE
jgi:hypothetical protein